MRVLLDAKEMRARATGVARYERELLARLTRSVDAIVLVRRAAVADGSTAALTGRVIPLPNRLPSSIVEQVVVPLFTWLTRPDVLHTLAGAQSIFGRRGRRVLTFHEDRRTYFERFPPTGRYARVAAWWHVWSAEQAARKADAVLTVSETAARDLVTTGLTDPARLLPVQHGVSNDFHADGSIERGSFVLMLASDDPRDEPEMVIEATAALGGGAELVVAGRIGEAVQDRMRRASRNHHVRPTFVGEVSDRELAALYRTCLCFVHASDYEGFGLAVLEAMACGAVVVGRPSPALAEVAGHLALTGRDEKELGQQLVEVARDPGRRADLARGGIQRSRSFTWDRAVQLTLRAYQA